MKIYFPIGAFYPSQIGGPCNTLYWHTGQLTRNGIEVNIFTTTSGIKTGLVRENEKLNTEISGERFTMEEEIIILPKSFSNLWQKTRKLILYI